MNESKMPRTDDESTLAAMVRELDAKLADALAAKERAEEALWKWCDDFTKLEPELRRMVEFAKQCQAERDALAAKLAEAETALSYFIGAKISVARSIDDRGYTWCEAYLDQALPYATAAIDAARGVKHG
jgi:chromosome segregation ATPase